MKIPPKMTYLNIAEKKFVTILLKDTMVPYLPMGKQALEKLILY